LSTQRGEVVGTIVSYFACFHSCRADAMRNWSTEIFPGVLGHEDCYSHSFYNVIWCGKQNIYNLVWKKHL